MSEAVKRIREIASEAVKNNDPRLLMYADGMLELECRLGNIGMADLFKLSRELRNCALLCKGGTDET